MMSFVERRQIYLNGTGQGQEKPEQKKYNTDPDSSTTADRETKQSARKFPNMATADKTELGTESMRTEPISTPRSLAAPLEAKSESKTGDARRSASKSKQHLPGAEYLARTVQLSKNATRTLRKSKNDMASILQLQLEQ